MSQKKILFLGGAFSQLPVIEYARKKGCYVITADYLPENPGHKIANAYYKISTVDLEKILELSRKEKIDAISAYASDPSALTAAFVSEKMGLIGSSFHSVNTLSDKVLFREFLQKNNFNVPWFLGAKELDALLKEYPGGKAFLKPVDSSGSKGVFFVSDERDIKKYFETSKSFSRQGKVILEQFIDRKGPQIHGEGFLVNGEMVFLELGDQFFSKVNPYAPYCTVAPSFFHQDVMPGLHSLVDKAVKKVGFKNGGINVEVIRDHQDNLYILEIGPRNGGNFMPQLMHCATEFDLVKANVDAMLGELIQSLKEFKSGTFFAQIILHSDKSGYFNGLNIPEPYSNNILKKFLYFKKGDLVNVYKNSKDVIGVLILEIGTEDHLPVFLNLLGENKWVKIEE